jgi:hypothetical protein
MTSYDVASNYCEALGAGAALCGGSAAQAVRRAASQRRAAEEEALMFAAAFRGMTKGAPEPMAAAMVGPGRYCSPRHLPSCIELNGTS